MMANYQHQDVFPKQEEPPVSHQQWNANAVEKLQETTFYQEQPFDIPQGTYDQYTLPPGLYNNFDYSEQYNNYNETFPGPQIDHRANYNTFPPGNAMNMQAEPEHINPPLPEYPWADEIHQSYIPATNVMYGWAPSDTEPYNWMIPTATLTPQISYQPSPATVHMNQLTPSPVESIGSDSFGERQFVPDMVPRLNLLQYPVPTPPMSVVNRTKKQMAKLEFATSPYEILDPNGQRPLRVSKSKKLKGDSGGKQEACWRCKRYRKAVCSWSISADMRLTEQVYR